MFKVFVNNDWIVKGIGFFCVDGIDILKVDLINVDELKKVFDDVKYVLYSK